MTNSLYEKLFPLTTIMKQRVVENFTGDSLDTDRWTQETVTGSPTFGMNDSGSFIKTGTVINGSGAFSFNVIRQFAYNGAVYITVAKQTSTSNTRLSGGFMATSVATGGTQSVFQGDTILDTNYRLQNSYSGGTTNTSSSTAVDTSFHTHKIENKASSIDYSVDGATVVTSTTNLPNLNQQPMITVVTRDTVESEMTVRYMECYNT